MAGHALGTARADGCLLDGPLEGGLVQVMPAMNAKWVRERAMRRKDVAPSPFEWSTRILSFERRTKTGGTRRRHRGQPPWRSSAWIGTSARVRASREHAAPAYGTRRRAARTRMGRGARPGPTTPQRSGRRWRSTIPDSRQATISTMPISAQFERNYSPLINGPTAGTPHAHGARHGAPAPDQSPTVPS